MADGPALTGARPPEGGPPPKLLDRVRTAVRLRHYSRRTEKAYVDWIRRYIVFHQKKHPSAMGATEIVAFLSWLAVDRRVSASTQNQALSALLFLYRVVLGLDIGPIEHMPRARMPDKLPVVLSREEVGQLITHVDGTMWLIVALLYGAGLRLEECLDLRVKDLDFDRNQIVVRRGKGQKDRVTMLPVAAQERLAAHLSTVRRQHERDLARGEGRVVLPFALDRKYSEAATAWACEVPSIGLTLAEVVGCRPCSQPRGNLFLPEMVKLLRQRHLSRGCCRDVVGGWPQPPQPIPWRQSITTTVQWAAAC